MEELQETQNTQSAPTNELPKKITKEDLNLEEKTKKK